MWGEGFLRKLMWRQKIAFTSERSQFWPQIGQFKHLFTWFKVKSKKNEKGLQSSVCAVFRFHPSGPHAVFAGLLPRGWRSLIFNGEIHTTKDFYIPNGRAMAQLIYSLTTLLWDSVFHCSENYFFLNVDIVFSMVWKGGLHVTTSLQYQIEN